LPPPGFASPDNSPPAPQRTGDGEAEFRASAVKLANVSDKLISQVAKDLGINVNTLHTWISKYSRPKEIDGRLEAKAR
jgi:transposase-like protein